MSAAVASAIWRLHSSVAGSDRLIAALPLEPTSRPAILCSPLSLINASFALMIYLVDCPLPGWPRSELPVFEGSHRLGNETSVRVAHLAVAECHGTRSMIRMGAGRETRPRIGGLEEIGFHLHRHSAARGGTARPPPTPQRHITRVLWS